MKNLISTLLLLSIVFSFGCSGGGHSANQHGDEVQWDAITQLDLGTEKALAVLSGPSPNTSDMLEAIQIGIQQVATSAPPQNIKNREEVATLLSDLESLAPTLASPSDPAQALDAVHELILTIMETAGIPHKHDHGHDHGHDGHDHGHDGHDH